MNDLAQKRDALLTQAAAQISAPPAAIAPSADDDVEGELVPVLGTEPADDAVEIIRDGDAAESAALADRLIAALAEMPDADQLKSFKAQVAADLPTLAQADRDRFNTAFIERQRALATWAKR